MPRLRNAQTGAVVSCSDETAGRLGGDWQPVEQEKEPQKRTRKPAAKTKSDD